MDTLPLTPTGKIDRPALTVTQESRLDLRTEYDPPRTPYEEQLTVFWRDMFGFDHIGRNDNVLQLGGHSLQVFALFSAIEKQWQVSLPVSTLHQSTDDHSLV